MKSAKRCEESWRGWKQLRVFQKRVTISITLHAIPTNFDVKSCTSDKTVVPNICLFRLTKFQVKHCNSFLARGESRNSLIWYENKLYPQSSRLCGECGMEARGLSRMHPYFESGMWAFSRPLAYSSRHSLDQRQQTSICRKHPKTIDTVRKSA